MQGSAKRVFQSDSGADRATWLGLLLCVGALLLLSTIAVVVIAIIQSNAQPTESVDIPILFWMNSGVLLVSCLAIGKGRFRFATLLTILFVALQLIAVTRFNNSFVSELPPRGVLHDAISAARVAVIVLVTMHLLYTLGGFVVLLKGAFAKQKQTKKRLYPLLLFYWRFLVVVWIAFFVTILVT